MITILDERIDHRQKELIELCRLGKYMMFCHVKHVTPLGGERGELERHGCRQ
jgi:hypothetical protein